MKSFPRNAPSLRKQFWMAGAIASSAVFLTTGVLYVLHTDRLYLLFVLSGNFSILALFALVLLRLYFSISRPLEDLTRGIRRYWGGDFSARVSVSGEAELQYVQTSFNELASKIEGLITELKSFDVMKSDFVSTVSHELRTPQTSISGYVKLILAQDAGEINPTQKEFLEIIDRNVDRLGLLINDILDTEKLESGRLVIRSERLDLVPLIREAMDTVQVLAKKKGLGLIYSGPDLGLFVLGDRERLLQVFLNLLTNAVKYTQKGQIEVRIEQADFAVFIRVQDTGIGLTEEEKSRIFEKFYRARAGLSASEGGTGLGLVISRGIILAHGGQIGVESQPGVGSTFSVSLPFSSRLPVLALETKAGDSNATVIEKTHTVWVLDRSLQRRKNWVNVFTQGQSTFSKTKVRCREFGHVEDVFEALAHVVDRPAVLVIAIDDGMIQARSTLSVLNRRMKGRIPVLLLGDGQNNSELIAIGVMGWLGLGASAVELRGALMDALAHRTANILLVEPDRDLRLLMRRGLEQAGLHVEDVSLGKEAVIKCNRDNYDLVLVSEELADLSSAETLVQLKKKGLRVVLVIPEEASAAHEKEILEKGFHAVATKAKGLQAFSQGILRLVNL